jgi:hypothetical protein
MIAVLFEAKAAPAHQARYLSLPQSSNLCWPTSTALLISNVSEPDHRRQNPVPFLVADEEAIRHWKQNVFHQAAQAEGRASIFAYYRIRVAQVVREYSSETGGHADV